MDLALEFFVPIPFLSDFVITVFLSFFVPLLSVKKIWFVNFLEAVLNLFKMLESGALVFLSSWLPIPISLRFTILIYATFFIGSILIVPIVAIGITYLQYLLYRRLFKKWYHMLEAVT